MNAKRQMGVMLVLLLWNAVPCGIASSCRYCCDPPPRYHTILVLQNAKTSAGDYSHVVQVLHVSGDLLCDGVHSGKTQCSLLYHLQVRTMRKSFLGTKAASTHEYPHERRQATKLQNGIDLTIFP